MAQTLTLWILKPRRNFFPGVRYPLKGEELSKLFQTLLNIIINPKLLVQDKNTPMEYKYNANLTKVHFNSPYGPARIHNESYIK